VFEGAQKRDTGEAIAAANTSRREKPLGEIRHSLQSTAERFARHCSSERVNASSHSSREKVCRSEEEKGLVKGQGHRGTGQAARVGILWSASSEPVSPRQVHCCQQAQGCCKEGAQQARQKVFRPSSPSGSGKKEEGGSPPQGAKEAGQEKEEDQEEEAVVRENGRQAL
jgi:hypothetical protein